MKLSEHSNNTLDQLKLLVMNFGVVIVRNQEHLDIKRFRDIGLKFGNLQVHQESFSWHPEYNDVNIISNMRNKSTGKFIGLHGGDVELFHSDLAWDKNPSSFTMLKGIITSENEGLTIFSDSISAYEALDNHVKQDIDGKQAEFSYTKHHKPSCTDTKNCTQNFPPVVHQVVSVHPVTGRRSIYASAADTTKVLGMTASMSTEILSILDEQIAKPQFQYAHKWRSGDLLIWDNRITQHRSGGCPSSIPRKLIRITVK